MDEFGQRYQADMVRLGSQPGDAVRAVTLKARVDSLASSATGLRFSAGAIAATGGSAAEATPRSRAEQAAHVSKLTAKRAKRVEEQLGLARKRAQHRQHSPLISANMSSQAAVTPTKATRTNRIMDIRT